MKRIELLFLIFASLCFAGNKAEAQDADGLVNVRINEGVNNSLLKSNMEKNAGLFLNAINKAAQSKKKPKLSADFIDKTAMEKLENMWKTSAMECSKAQIEENCMNTIYGNYQIRNIPVTLYSASDETKREEIALNFDRSGKIIDVNITLKETQYAQILGESKLVEDIVNRNKILDFIEKFRTAYNCKDVYYLDNVFSNNALIITANEIRQKPNSDQAIKSLGNKEYVFQVQTKTEYLQKLKDNVFKKNAYLNIVFDSVKVLQHPGYDNVYGVSLKQFWNSTNYRDVGFLYLLIDCRNENEMQIYVRAWHPDEYFNFNSFDKFKFYN